MAISYTVCDPEVDKLIAVAIKDYHKELDAAGVTIHAVFARNFDGDGEPIAAVKAHGVAAAAKIQITSLVDRVRGIKDAKLTIDGHYWDRASESRRLALLDHELEHLTVQTDDAGVKFDDAGRPKLRMRHHDWELTGFASVVERHGEASVEAQQFSYFQDEFGQLCLFGPMSGKAVSNELLRKAAQKFDKEMKKGLGDGFDSVTITDDDGKEIYHASK